MAALYRSGLGTGSSRCIVGLLLFFTFPAFSQNIPVVDDKGWVLSAGNSFSIPVSGTYSDFSLVKFSDYFWEYRATPAVSFAAPFISLDRVRSASFRSNNTGYYSYGISYKEGRTGITYSGWEGGGISGVFFEGTGKKNWTDHYLETHYKITHQFGVGKANRTVLNTLGFSAAFNLYETEIKGFKGEFNGESYEQEYVDRGLPNKWYVPQLKLNYEFSMVFHSKRFMILPNVSTSLLYFNNFLDFGKPEGGPLNRRSEYYKEISFGVSFMRR